MSLQLGWACLLRSGTSGRQRARLAVDDEPGLRALMLCALRGLTVAVDAQRTQTPLTSNHPAIRPAADGNQKRVPGLYPAAQD